MLYLYCHIRFHCFRRLVPTFATIVLFCRTIISPVAKPTGLASVRIGYYFPRIHTYHTSMTLNLKKKSLLWKTRISVLYIYIYIYSISNTCLASYIYAISNTCLASIVSATSMSLPPSIKTYSLHTVCAFTPIISKWSPLSIVVQIFNNKFKEWK